jgi:hypothetical protein
LAWPAGKKRVRFSLTKTGRRSIFRKGFVFGQEKRFARRMIRQYARKVKRRLKIEIATALKNKLWGGTLFMLPTTKDLLYRNSLRNPGKLAVANGPVRYTFAGFAERCNRLANLLLDLGLQKGDRVAFLDKTCPLVFRVLLRDNHRRPGGGPLELPAG